MAPSVEVTVKVNDEEYIVKLAHVMSAAFFNDNFNSYLLRVTEGLSDDAIIPHEQRVKSMLPRLRNRAAAGAHFVEAGNWAAAASWLVF